MNYSWVPTTIYASIPFNAVLAGYDSDGCRIYIGRTYFQCDQVPCKIIPAKGTACISYNGTVHYVDYFEILCGYGLRWVAASHGMIPQGAIPVGYCLSGDTLFIGRTHLLGSLTPGKVSRLHRCLYVPFNGREYATPVYEVLVCYPLIHLNYKSSCSIQ